MWWYRWPVQWGAPALCRVLENTASLVASRTPRRLSSVHGFVVPRSANPEGVRAATARHSSSRAVLAGGEAHNSCAKDSWLAAVGFAAAAYLAAVGGMGMALAEAARPVSTSNECHSETGDMARIMGFGIGSGQALLCTLTTTSISGNPKQKLSVWAHTCAMQRAERGWGLGVQAAGVQATAA